MQGSKNAVLPMMAASLLQKGTVILRHCPRIDDVRCMEEILRYTGARTWWQKGISFWTAEILSQGKFRGRMRIKCAPLFFYWAACCRGWDLPLSVIREAVPSDSARWICICPFCGRWERN